MTWENSPALARRWKSSIASWVRYCRPAILRVLSQPFLRHRHAVHVETPTCSNHRDKLTTAALATGCDLPFDSILTRAIVPLTGRTLVYHKHRPWRSGGPVMVDGKTRWVEQRSGFDVILCVQAYLIRNRGHKGCRLAFGGRVGIGFS